MSEPRVWKQIAPHAFKTDHPVARVLGRALCVNCGLVRLKNTLTDWCVSKGCDYREHPGFVQATRTLPAAWRSGSGR